MKKATYTIPEADRARLRDLRTIYAEGLMEAEHDAIAKIILRGSITSAESAWVLKTHAEQRMALNPC